MRRLMLFLMVAVLLTGITAQAAVITIDTAYGNGADAVVWEDDGGDGGSFDGPVFHRFRADQNRHETTLLRFDLSQIVPGSVISAELHMINWRDQAGSGQQGWGLNDGVGDGHDTGDGLTTHQGEFWVEDASLIYSTAPETYVDNDGTTRLETFSNSTALGAFDATGVEGEDVITLSGADLVDFLNADTNGVVTLTIESLSSDLWAYTSKENGTLNGGPAVAPYLLLEAQTPDAASNPSPANGDPDVDPAGLSLSWDAPTAPGTFTYDVYMNSPSDPNLLLVSGDQSGTSYTPSPELAYIQEYSWRVDSRQGGSVIASGGVWSFTTGGSISNLSPADGAQKQGYETILLDWDAGAVPDSFDVYISTDGNDLGTPTNTTETELLVAVDPNTAYYWAVDTKDAGGSVQVAGDTLSFSTGDLMAHWKLDDGSGLVAADSSGNGYDGTVVDPNLPWTTGVIRGGIEYHPTVDSPTTAFHNMGVVDQFSYSGWYKRPNLPVQYALLTYSAGSDWSSYIAIQNNSIGLRFSGESTVALGAFAAENNWQHLVVTMDSSSDLVRTYLDGVLESVVNMSVPALSLGNGAKWGIFMGGPMDDLRLYNAVLSAEDVADLYAQGAQAKNPDPADTEDRLPLDVVCQWDPGFEIDSQVFVLDNDANMASPLEQTAISTGGSYDPLGGADLVLNTDYYWRVDSIQGSYTIEGSVWTFKTIPPVATVPDPADTATGVAQNKILGWLAGAGFDPNSTDEHQVYIAAGTGSGDLPGIPTATVSAEAYDPDLDFETAYVWRVDELIGGTLYTGSAWTFTTGAPICDPELAGDTNGDCIVNLTDVAALAANWLDCTLANAACP